MIKKKLWLRKLDCGHSRPTNIAFISRNYEKPKVGDKCYCRECWKESTIISVEEVSQDDYTLEKNKNPVYLEKLSKQTGGNK